MSIKGKLGLAALAVFVFSVSAFSQKVFTRAATAGAQRAIIISTEPNATVWVDDVKRGVTDAAGKLAGVKLSAASKILRIRAAGFKQSVTNLTAATKGTVTVKLAVTGDKAELLFQKAEALRETPLNSEDRDKAVELYREALKLRPNFAEAHLGLARVFFDLKDTDNAMIEVKQARKYRAAYPEASAVEGRIFHDDADDENAIKSYQRAIKEGGGYQPEAHTGLGIIYREQENYEDAIKEFKTAIAQLFDTEPVIYQLLGDLLEKTRRFKEAVAIYEQFLKAAPDGPDAIAVKSMIDQLKIQIAEDQPE